MSSSAYASVLRNLGGVHNTRRRNSAGGSGSGANHEDAAESAAPITDPIPTNENVEDVVEIPDASEVPVTKKRKHPATKPPKFKGPVIEKVSCDGEGKSLDGGSVHVGNFTLEKLISTMAEIPTDEDWEEMEEAGLSSVLKRAAGHWGRVSNLSKLLIFFCFTFLMFLSGLFSVGWIHFWIH